MSNVFFQYAVLRYFHDPATQEFLNIGVVIYSKETRYLKALINKRFGRVSKTFETIDRNHYGRMANSIDNEIERLGITLARTLLLDDYPIAIEDLLKQVLPQDDTSLRFGGFGGGVVNDLDAELSRLFYRLVEKYEGRNSPESRRDDQIWHDYAKLFLEYPIIERLEPKLIHTPEYSYQFAHAYKNGRWNPLEAVSLDLADSSYILEKANKWIGRAIQLGDSPEIGTLYLLLGAPTKPELTKFYESAIRSLETKITNLTVKVVREEESKEFSKELAVFINQPHEP